MIEFHGWAPHLFCDFAIWCLILCGVFHWEFVNPEVGVEKFALSNDDHVLFKENRKKDNKALRLI